MRAKRLANRFPIKHNHNKARLHRTRIDVTWTLNDRSPVLCTDESWFYVDFTDIRARVWRSTNERFAPVCIANHDRYGGWGLGLDRRQQAGEDQSAHRLQ